MINRVSFFNDDAREATATIERIIADARHAIRNRDAHKTTAILERRIADARHAIRNRDAREATAIGERPSADARHAVFDDYRFDAISVTVPRHRRRIIIIRHFPRSANRQRSGHGIERPRYIIPVCPTTSAIGLRRRGQDEKRRQGGDEDNERKTYKQYFLQGDSLLSIFFY